MEKVNKGNYNQENYSSNNDKKEAPQLLVESEIQSRNEDEIPLNNKFDKKEDTDDFHKNDDLHHNYNGEKIDATGTDPNRYANLASQDVGEEKSLYSDEDSANTDSSSESTFFNEGI